MIHILKGSSTKIILISISIGIWVIALQNMGIIPTNQNVKVTNIVEADVSGNVDIGNTVKVNGYIDVNVAAINGNPNAFYDFNGNRNYVRIPVYLGN